ncbi:MAG TPA: MlaD family protein [Kofleriaceae bacterium]|nr:MlaD family protein [Kofleriaceae bacterium]
MSLAAQDERLTRRVGAVTLVLLAAGIAFAIFVAPRIEWGRHIRVRVYFVHTGGLREGAPVVVAGRSIGRIESIARAPHGAPGPLGGDEGVVVTAAISARMASRLPRDGDFFVASRGTLSERYLEIGPASAAHPAGAAGAAATASAPPLAEGDELRGRDPPTLDRVLQRTWHNLTVAREFGRAIRPELDLLRQRLAELGETIDAIAEDAGGAGAIVADVLALRAEARALREVGLGGDRGLAQLDAVIAGTRALIARARGALDSRDPAASAASAGAAALRATLARRGPSIVARFGLAIARARAAMDRLDPLLAKVAELRGRLERGEGSLGRLMRDPEFPEDAKELGKILKRQPWKIIDRPPD